MSSRANLRRSRRAPKKLSEYQVGDLVELKRNNNTVVRGRLAQLLTAGGAAASANSRWLIKFESSGLKDEEVYEKALGKIVQRRTTSPVPSTSTKSEDDESAMKREQRVKRRTKAKKTVGKTAAAVAAKKRGRKYKLDANEQVTKVKLLTGTLYVYRSGNRKRAEFVRRV